MKTKLFITGSSGFIGFHVAKNYLDKGFKVHGFDSMNNYYDVKLKKSRLKILKKYKNFTFTKGNLENQKILKYLEGKNIKRKKLQKKKQKIFTANQKNSGHTQKEKLEIHLGIMATMEKSQHHKKERSVICKQRCRKS